MSDVRGARPLGAGETTATGHRREHHDLVAVGDGGAEPAGEADVLVVDVDVDEAAFSPPV